MAIASPSVRAITKPGRTGNVTGLSILSCAQSCGAYEYEDWPCGRIVFNRSRDLFITYADRKPLTPATIDCIKTRFHLPAERTEVQSDMHYQSKETPNGVEIYRTAHIAISARRKSQCLASPECDFELCLQVLQSEIQINAIAEGYDPTIGIMHEGRDSSSAFIFDLMEPEGPRLIVGCWNSSRYMCSIRAILLFGRMVCVGLIQRWRGAW
jgi:hypothetical protein